MLAWHCACPARVHTFPGEVATAVRLTWTVNAPQQRRTNGSRPQFAGHHVLLRHTTIRPVGTLCPSTHSAITPHMSPVRSAAALGGSPDDTESAFYDALQRGDIDLLMQCWAEEDDILCVHPGGPRMLGARAIRAAFEAMFAHGAVHARPLQVHRISGVSSAVHSVIEQVEMVLPDGVHRAMVLATNVYHRTPEGWRMVAHHASPGAAPEADMLQAQKPRLH